MVSLTPAEKIALLMAIFVVLNATDWAMTMYGLSHGAAESNPVVRANLSNIVSASTTKLVELPLLFVITNCVVFLVGRKMNLALVMKVAFWIAVAVNIIYLGIFVNNLLILHFSA